MKITKEIFEKSFFSIGGGYDIQPLLRFSHVCDFFINVNLFLEKEEVISWYDNAFKYYDFELLEKTVINKFDEEKFFELNAEYIQHLTHPDFITSEELIDYQNAFSDAIGLEQYAVIYKLYRKTVNRTIWLYFCTAEGLASYITLSQNGKYAPNVISTIETGVLENPDGILNRFFRDNSKKQPGLWIRGFEPRYFPFKIPNNALDTIGIFNKKVLDFNSTWTCGWSYPRRQCTITRYCKGYIPELELSRLNKLSLKKEFENKKHKFLFEKIDKNPSEIKDDDYLVISKKTKLNFDRFPCNVLFWEDFIYNYQFSFNNVSKQFLNLSETLKENRVPISSTIHIIPFCLEDQGIKYYHSVIALDNETITYLPNAYDFIDLKGL